MAVKTLSGGQATENKLASIATRVRRPGTLEVGFLAGATYPDGTPVAMVAAIQEFGSPSRNIPPRPFFRHMILDKSPGWGEALGKLVVRADFDAPAALNLMGEHISGQLRESIHGFTDPPLSPRTVARKGFSKPLVDTGHMLNSVASKVVT